MQYKYILYLEKSNGDFVECTFYAVKCTFLAHFFQIYFLYSHNPEIMKVLICDDKEEEANALAVLFSSLNVENVVFTDTVHAFDYICSGAKIDACFLDIVMPEINGIELAEKLRQNNFDGKIIFLTTSNDFAHESYKVKAFDYLIKPPTLENITRVLKSLEDASKDNDTDGLVVKTQGNSKVIPFRDISHVEVIDHIVFIMLSDRSIIKENTTFGEMAERLLRDSRFARCHRSYIVNVNKIAVVSNREVVMENGAKIPVSRGYSQVKDEMLKWMFRKK